MMTRLPLKVLTVVLVLVVSLVVAAPSVAAPASGPMNATIHVVQPGETLYSIARGYGVDVYVVASANNVVNPNLIYAGQSLVIPGGYGYAPHPYHAYDGASVYVVRPGDTMYSIAARYGTTVWALAQANNLSNPNWIFAGQKLVIPGGYAGYPAPQPGYAHHPVVVKKVVVVHQEPPPLRPAVCNESTKITYPLEGETLDGLGTQFVTGTASIDDFQFYKLEFGFGAAPIDLFSLDEVQTKPVVNGILGSWNTGALPEGTYTLRLTVVDNSGQFPPPCDVVVNVDHPAGVDP
ncbi:MAG: LysM peptidoglycan-binding domain-containing protein [Anaerolineae bacterium]